MTSPKGLLDPAEAVIVFIDHQPMTLFGVRSHDPQQVVDNTVALAEIAKVYGVPVVYTTVAREALGGDLIPGLKEVFPDQEIIDRTWINAWEDPELKAAVLATGRRQLVIAGLWTEMCVAFPAISALEEGREVFVVADASGGATSEAHDRAMDRMVAKGAVPLTTQVVLGEFQRDWGRPGTYAGATAVAKKYFGNWGQVLDYYAQAVGGPVSGHGKAETDKVEASTAS